MNLSLCTLHGLEQNKPALQQRVLLQAFRSAAFIVLVGFVSLFDTSTSRLGRVPNRALPVAVQGWPTSLFYVNTQSIHSRVHQGHVLLSFTIYSPLRYPIIWAVGRVAAGPARISEFGLESQLILQ